MLDKYLHKKNKIKVDNKLQAWNRITASGFI